MSEALFRIREEADGRRVIVADDPDAVDMMMALPAGRAFTGQFKARRNPQHHKLLFAMLRDVCASGAWDGDEESLLLWLKLRCRLVDVHEVDGRTVTVPKSVSFASMGQDRFRRFFDRACYWLCSDLLGGTDWEAFRDELIARIEGPYADPRTKEAA